MKLPGPHWRFVIEMIVILALLALGWWSANQCTYIVDRVCVEGP